MKIRNGFVSNSSSSSFLIYGTSFDPYEFSESELEKIREKCLIILKGYNGKNERLKEGLENLIKDFESVDVEDFKDELNEYLEFIASYNEDGLDIYYVDDDIFIGRCPEDADESITFGEWKNNIKNDVDFLIPGYNDFSWLEDCSYDG